MKRWKALVLLGTLCLGLLLPWQAAAQEEPAGQLAEESGAAGVTEQLDWDVQSVLEQLGLSVTAPDETGEKFTLSHIWQVFSDYLSGRISQPFAMLGGLLEHDTKLRETFVAEMGRQYPALTCTEPEQDAAAGALMLAKEML